MSKRPTDDELRRAILGAPRYLTVRQLAELLTLTFGHHFSRAAAHRLLKRLGIAKPKPSKLDKDAEQRALVEARLLAGDTCDEVLAQARARFGAQAIGRSSVHRHLSRMRVEGRHPPPADGAAKGR